MYERSVSPIAARSFETIRTARRNANEEFVNHGGLKRLNNAVNSARRYREGRDADNRSFAPDYSKKQTNKKSSTNRSAKNKQNPSDKTIVKLKANAREQENKRIPTKEASTVANRVDKIEQNKARNKSQSVTVSSFGTANASENARSIGQFDDKLYALAHPNSKGNEATLRTASGKRGSDPKRDAIVNALVTGVYDDRAAKKIYDSLTDDEKARVREQFQKKNRQQPAKGTPNVNYQSGTRYMNRDSSGQFINPRWGTPDPTNAYYPSRLK